MAERDAHLKTQRHTFLRTRTPSAREAISGDGTIRKPAGDSRASSSSYSDDVIDVVTLTM